MEKRERFRKSPNVSLTRGKRKGKKNRSFIFFLYTHGLRARRIADSYQELDKRYDNMTLKVAGGKRHSF